MEADGELSPYRLILLLSLPTIWHKRYGCNVETAVEKYPQKMRFLTRELAGAQTHMNGKQNIK